MTAGPAARRDREAALSERGCEPPTAQDWMRDALVVYGPDLGLAIHRACEARLVSRASPNALVLDLGCGDGRFARLWTRRLDERPRLLGVDLRSGDLQRAHKAAALRHALVANACELPLADGCVRTVIANSVLTHVSELDRLLDEVGRVLQPGGWLLAAVPGPAFEQGLASVRLLRALGLRSCARRRGARYHLRWRQLHRDGEAAWARRLAAHGLLLSDARPYPGPRASFVWSLLFTAAHAGVGGLRPVALLDRLWPGQGAEARPGRWLVRRLAPLLDEPGSEAASLFLRARRVATAPRSPASASKPGSLPLEGPRQQPDHAAILAWLAGPPIRVEGESPVTNGGYGNWVDGRSGRAPMLYCEITGYAAQFWLRQKREKATLARAAAAGDCLLRVQAGPDAGVLGGAFPYGLTRPEGRPIPAYFSFDAAIGASALVDLAFRTGEPRFHAGAERAGHWLTRMQTASGGFVAMQVSDPQLPLLPSLEEWFGDGCALHGKNAIALIKLGELTGEVRWRQAARRTLDWLCSWQGDRGEFAQRPGSRLSMSHTHCYATEGLLYAGLVLGEERYLAAGVRGAGWLECAQRRDGALHWNYLSAGKGLPRAERASPLHVGPVAQAVRLWWVADQISPAPRWREAARRGLEFLARVQARASSRWVAGALPQGARAFGPWLRRYPIYSAWEAMFSAEAVRLWNSAEDDTAWSLF